MNHELIQNAQQLNIKRRRKSRWHKVVTTMAGVVVFCTTYALILPAITLEQEAFCGLEEHTHTEACYTQTQQRTLICTPESLGVHTHGAECLDEDGNVVCGQADYVVHTHDDTCVDAEGTLVCTFPEAAAHVHTQECYAPVETEAVSSEPVMEVHTHTDACYTQVQGELQCEIVESEGHTHADACYTTGTTLQCTKAENHIHSESCYETVLQCQLSTEGHSHSSSCYGPGTNLLCTTEAGHVHGEGCFETVLQCQSTEEDHIHDENCYLTNQICTIPENHAHDAACYEQVLTCTAPVTEAHTHTDACYGTGENLACGETEGHVHSDACYEQILQCQTPESEGHTHGTDCYIWNEELTCGLEEGQEVEVIPETTAAAEPELICKEPVAIVHIHTEDCFYVEETEPTLTCTQPEDETHTHTQQCYGTWTYICGLEEHTHELTCYSDPTADVETAEVWERTFAHVTLTGDYGKDVLAIAETQLGYTESTRNYAVWEDDSMHGYTRYGDWYGSPYGDWCAMFVSFCLHYAKVEGMPLNWGVRPWIEELTELQLYHVAEEYTPNPGNLVFYDWEGDGLSDHVGIVAEVIEATDAGSAKIRAIEGNSDNRVQYVTYEKQDARILGYAALPSQTSEAEPDSTALTAVIYTDGSYETVSEDSTIITLTGDLPEDARVMAFPVTVQTELEVLCAYDIAIVLPNGTLYEPESAVTVSIRSQELEADQQMAVYHVPDEGAPEPVNCESTDDGILFETDHFSVYMVTAADGAFHYTDETTGMSASLTLTSDYYTPDKFTLVVERMDQNNYENALRTFTSHGQVLDEVFIYKIYLKDSATGQSFTNLGCAYELEMSWETGLFETVESSDLLDFTYCKNPNSEPTTLPNCELATDENGNILTLSASDGYYPNSSEFIFLRSSTPNGLIAGNYDLQYNEVKDAFLSDPAYSIYYNANSPIGTAGSFHLVAFDTAYLNAHTNGNILARTLHAGSNFGTNNLADELSYIQNYAQINSTSASSANHILVMGSEHEISFTDNGNAFSVNGTKIDKPYHLVQDKDTASAPFIDLNRVEKEVSQIASRLNGFPNANLTYQSASELNANYSKLILNSPSGVGVAHYTAAELSEYLGGYVRIDGFKSGTNGTVVINVDCTGVTQINMPQARVVVDGQEMNTSEVTDFSAGKVIWNFTNAEGVTIKTHLMTGIVVAPGATVAVNQNLNGTVVADNIYINAESHRTDFTGTVVEPDEPVEDEEYYITVQKIETGFAGTTLPGAEFDLYAWNGTDWVKTNGESLVTNASGVVTLRRLEGGVAYKLVETKSPEGYILKDGAFFFWVRSGSSQKAPETAPDDFSGSAIEIGGTLLAANDADVLIDEGDGNISIRVQKYWADAQGNPLDSVDISSVLITLYRSTGEADAEKTVFHTAHLQESNNWEYTFQLLPLTGTDEEGKPVKYTYTVEETEVDGFTASYETSEDGKTVTITNTQTEDTDDGYVLPETGGIGSHWYTLGGLLCMSMASVLLYIHKKGKRRWFSA